MHAVFFKKSSFQLNQRPSESISQLFRRPFYIQYFCLFFQPRNQFIGQVEISLSAFGVGIVGEGGKAVAGGFGEADVAGDDGVEE